MIKFENTVTIHRPVEDVFRFVAHFENIPLWNYYVTSVRQISEGVPAQGTLYHQIRKEDQQDYQIVDYQPNHRLSIKTTPGSSPAFERILTFEAIDTGTQIEDVWELETGYNRLVERLGAGRVKAGVAENLEKLKQLLESGETRLQDGRVITLSSQN